MSSNDTNLDICNRSVPNTPQYNIQAIEATELYAPYCTTEYSQHQGSVNVGLGLLFGGSNAVNTATTEGCQNYTKMIEKYYTSACAITKILNSVSSVVGQVVGSSQSINVKIINSQVNCDSYIISNQSTANMKSVQNMSATTKTEIKSTLSSSIKSLFEESVNTIIDGGDSSVGNQVITNFNSQITNDLFTDIVNNMSNQLNQFYSGSQSIEYTVEASNLTDCKLMQFSNNYVIDMEAYIAATSAVSTAISQTTFVESLHDLAISLDKIVDTTLKPRSSSSKFMKIFMTILAIGIGIALIVGIIYLLSKPKKVQQTSQIDVTKNIPTITNDMVT